MFNPIKWLLNRLKRQRKPKPKPVPILRQPLTRLGNQAKHSDLSKFFKGKGQKPHSTYRRMIQEQKKPEE